jgi:hypothetical protein
MASIHAVLKLLVNGVESGLMPRLFPSQASLIIAARALGQLMPSVLILDGKLRLVPAIAEAVVDGLGLHQVDTGQGVLDELALSECEGVHDEARREEPVECRSAETARSIGKAHAGFSVSERAAGWTAPLGTPPSVGVGRDDPSFADCFDRSQSMKPAATQAHVPTVE